MFNFSKGTMNENLAQQRDNEWKFSTCTREQYTMARPPGACELCWTVRWNKLVCSRRSQLGFRLHVSLTTKKIINIQQSESITYWLQGEHKEKIQNNNRFTNITLLCEYKFQGITTTPGQTEHLWLGFIIYYRKGLSIYDVQILSWMSKYGWPLVLHNILLPITSIKTKWTV